MKATNQSAPSQSSSPVRDRILATAYDLFAYRGFRAVGVDEIIGRTGIAKATFYRHFPTKNELGLAFLTRREQLWTHDYFEARSRLGGRTPEGQLLAMFDVFDEWFRRTDFEGCSFITILLEVGSSHPLGEACVEQLGNIRAIVESLARDAGLTDAHEFAHQWHTLLKGAIVGACEGDLEAASRVRPVAEALIDLHRPKVALEAVRSNGSPRDTIPNRPISVPPTSIRHPRVRGR